jgi:hypothetical protein
MAVISAQAQTGRRIAVYGQHSRTERVVFGLMILDRALNQHPAIPVPCVPESRDVENEAHTRPFISSSRISSQQLGKRGGGPSLVETREHEM